MYFFLILFFISLSGIVLMIGRKLILLGAKKEEYRKEILLETFDLDDIKYIAVKNAKKYGFIFLVITMRFSIKSSHALKNGYKDVKNKIKNMIENRLAHKYKDQKVKEVSNFLKMVSDYKHKIRSIKHKIKEEEGIE